MKSYTSRDSYISDLQGRDRLPEGFKIGLTSFQFQPKERLDGPQANMNMTAIILDEPTPSFGAVFTKNAVPGYPVRIGRELLNQPLCQGILVNNKIANVCAPGGRESAERVCESFQKALNRENIAPLFPSSTGVIGWSLPEEEMIAQSDTLVKSLDDKELLGAAQGIMTTDSFPKMRSVSLGSGVLSGIAKGAGMIEPNMATMLVFLLSDVQLERDMLRRVLKRVCDRTFNRISVDSDQSTSDSVIMLSSNKKAAVSEEELEKALFQLCANLSEDVVRNGEGCAHVIKVVVKEAGSEKDAVGMGKALVNSPLTKTAVFGNDPNVGRFVQAVGDYAGNHDIPLDENTLKISLGDEVVYETGEFKLDSEKEIRLSHYLKSCALPTPSPGYPLHESSVVITVELGMGSCVATVCGSDLSYDYVKENADYRT